jgi:murein DD-endopeptidase MepM/ murein hydrolase activator NlpD
MKNRKRLVQILAGVMAAIMVLSLLFSLIPAAHAASSSEIRKQINDLKKQQGQLKNEKEKLREDYEHNEDEIADYIARKGILDQEIFLLHGEIELINEQISAFALLIADKQEELNEAQALYQDLNAEHRDRIRAMEEEGNLSYWEVLFKANSFADLLDRLNMIQEIAAADRRRLQTLTEAAALVEAARDALQVEKNDLEVTRHSLDAAQTDLENKKLEAQNMINELLDKAKDMEGLLEGFEDDEAALMAEIAKMEKEYNDAKYREWLAYIATATTATTAPPTTQPTTAPTDPTTKPTNPGQETEPTKPGQETEPPKNETEPTTAPTEPEPTEPETTQPPKATWIVPCYYVKLTSPFGNRESPTEGASTYHQGVDLAGPEGTPIYASRGGRVSTAKYSNSAGYYVSINHGDGFSSIYMHMTNYVVSAGQTVSQGQLIGYMGSTGISTGSHLHFGISYNGTYVNPVLYVPLY